MEKKEPHPFDKWAADNRARQPKWTAEMMSAFRGGREDAWNLLIPAFPGQAITREAGSPGSPTSQLTTEALTGRSAIEVLSTTSSVAAVQAPETPQQDPEVAAELARMQGNEQSRSRGR